MLNSNNPPQLSSVFQKIQEIGLDKPFQNPKLGVTVFIPNNAAYDRIMSAIGYNPSLVNNATIIKQAMYYHIVNKARKSRDFPRGTEPQATSLTGSKVMVTSDPNTFKIGGYNVLTRDIKAGKSYLNIIDGFLIPPSLIPTMLEATRAAAAKSSAPAATGRRLSEAVTKPAEAPKAPTAASIEAAPKAALPTPVEAGKRQGKNKAHKTDAVKVPKGYQVISHEQKEVEPQVEYITDAKGKTKAHKTKVPKDKQQKVYKGTVYEIKPLDKPYDPLKDVQVYPFPKEPKHSDD